jgi:general secretion pathway protein L
MLKALATWWASRMLELVPARLLRDSASVGPAVIVDAGDLSEPDEVRLIRRRNGQETPLGSVGGEVAVRVPSRLLLEQRVTLPLAAERDPGRVLQYDMDRLTPFAADAVFWSFAVLRQDRANKQLVLLLSLVPKAPLAELLASLGRAGLRPTVLEATRPDGTVRQIGLGAGRSRQAMVLTRAGGGLAVACGALAVAAIALPFVLQSLELDAVETRIATLRPQAAAASAARLRTATEIGTAGAAATERTRVGDALQALAAVTDLLPDDTYLTDLTLRARRLTIGGRSDAAVKLIPALAADRTIGNPALLAPVTRATSGRPDIFSIAAELK